MQERKGGELELPNFENDENQSLSNSSRNGSSSRKNALHLQGSFQKSKMEESDLAIQNESHSRLNIKQQKEESKHLI